MEQGDLNKAAQARHGAGGAPADRPGRPSWPTLDDALADVRTQVGLSDDAINQIGEGLDGGMGLGRANEGQGQGLGPRQGPGRPARGAR